MLASPYEVPPLSPEEKVLVATIDADWDRARALNELKEHLQLAVEIELATIPIYLGTYYTINRTPGTDNPQASDAFPRTAISRFADEAGALIMSVAVEEMLHMSLSSNVLYSLGQDPLLYKRAPASYPAVLPGHAQNVSASPRNDSRNIPIPLAKFSFEQLSHFLAIEYPAPKGAPPEPGNWDTIGQVYSFVRCIISSKWIEDGDFQVRAENTQQISSGDYSPSSIDTLYPNAEFDYQNPLPPSQAGSTASVTSFASDENSHVGATQLLGVSSCETALQAIATICFQGEGFDHTAFDDDDDDDDGEDSHYYKFLSLQSQLVGYDQAYIEAGKKRLNNAAPSPAAPPPADVQYSLAELDAFVYPAPANPVASQFVDGRKELVDIADGLFQYMLVMTETIYRIPAAKQKIYFYRTMHQSMIWVMDKFFQKIRTIKTSDGLHSLCPSFANVDLGSQGQAYANLSKMVTNFQRGYGQSDWFTESKADYYLKQILLLPDVSLFWQASKPTSLPGFLKTPDTPQNTGTNTEPPKAMTSRFYAGQYAGTPQWPLHPPASAELPAGAMRHACMGLNSCENQGRTLDNSCAGQGYCSTAMAYDPDNPFEGMASDHTCHVLNDCRNQGGCGLYGTEEEFTAPGHNECQSQGSCATPINAERFFTDGSQRGESVWQQARKVFSEKVWPELKAANPKLPEVPPPVPGSESNPGVFEYGPTIGWIEYDNDGQGMTACGSSGMSGAGSCA